MVSNRPYLLRAFYQWIVDSTCTPILVIDAHYPHHHIPQEYADGGEIIFNVSPDAVRDFNIANDIVEFRASFSGVVHLISVPVKAILALYAEENGEGIFFDAEEDAEVDGTIGLKSIEAIPASAFSDSLANSAKTKSKGKPFLKLVEKSAE